MLSLYTLQFVKNKIREELGDVPWTLLNRGKYALNIEAGDAAAASVDAMLEQVSVECSRQLVRYVLA